MSMTHDEMIAVIAAHRDGKTLQWAYYGGSVWQDLGAPEPDGSFNFQHFRYRIKPEPPKPREWWIYPIIGNHSCSIYSSPAAGYVHVREVLPDEFDGPNRIRAGGDIKQGDLICILGNTAYAYGPRRDKADDKPQAAVSLDEEKA